MVLFTSTRKLIRLITFSQNKWWQSVAGPEPSSKQAAAAPRNRDHHRHQLLFPTLTNCAPQTCNHVLLQFFLHQTACIHIITPYSIQVLRWEAAFILNFFFTHLNLTMFEFSYCVSITYALSSKDDTIHIFELTNVSSILGIRHDGKLNRTAVKMSQIRRVQ